MENEFVNDVVVNENEGVVEEGKKGLPTVAKVGIVAGAIAGGVFLVKKVIVPGFKKLKAKFSKRNSDTPVEVEAAEK